MRIIKFVYTGLAAVLLFPACDSDFNEIGTNIIGDNHFEFGTRADFEVIANSVATGPVQTNNQSLNPLGIYSDPIFGTTTANYVTQVELANPGVNLGSNPTIVSAVLKIPYVTTLESTSTDGSSTYSLGNNYKKGDGKIKLEVFRSGYYLRNQDQIVDGTILDQFYYNDQNSMIQSMTVGNRLNDATNSSENDNFFFDPAEYVSTTTDDDGNETTVRETPAMRLNLNLTAMQDVIFNASADQLLSNVAFKNYFRGLYFKVDRNSSNPTDENLSMLNFGGGTITITYMVDGTEVSADRVERTMTLKLAGNSISLTDNPNLPTVVPNDRLYVKGGAGYVTELDLFGPDSDGDGTPDSIEMMREENWMINEASLTFFVDKDAMENNTYEPTRLYLYDITNKKSILDYQIDNTTGPNSRLNKYVYGGIRDPYDTDRTVRTDKYKIRLTAYLRSLINNDSTTVKLGLGITEDITNSTMVRRKSGHPTFNQGTDFVPQAHVNYPFGTVLYGPNAMDENKRLKLTVYYTKPSDNQ